MVVPTKVFIGNLPQDCDEALLKQELESFGNIVEFDVVRHYAFAHFEKMDDAKEAVEAMDGKEFQGNYIKVELSHSRVRQKPGMGGKDECFRCGKSGHWSSECPTNPNRNRGSDRQSRRSRYDDDDYDYPSRSYGRRFGRDRGRYDDSYDDDYYGRRMPVPALDRFHPYASLLERRLPRDLFARDPYSRPPPDFYSAGRPRDPYLDFLLERAAAYRSLAPPPPLAGSAGRASAFGGLPTRERPFPY